MASGKLEPMADFFARRIGDYDEHMLRDIEGSKEFYPFTASMLPVSGRVLDLGCGTGLELDYYFSSGGAASVTGVDLSSDMLAALRSKHPMEKLELITGSYFDVPLGKDKYDAAVSVESLHHFTYAEKLPLYSKLHTVLKDGGYFILTDYFAPSDGEEGLCREELIRLKEEQGLPEDGSFHYDTPLTVAHETEALCAAGFSSVEVLGRWGATCTLKAVRDRLRIREAAENKRDYLPLLLLADEQEDMI